MATTERSAKPTTDHDFIKQWAEKRGGKPACVKGTGDNGDSGMIRIDFPGYSGQESLQPISWDEWFNQFEERKLALLVRGSSPDQGDDRFNKLVSRDSTGDED